jgi:pSer/pThr/pTyr-binding forkhead associated (FHA) protein
MTPNDSQDDQHTGRDASPQKGADQTAEQVYGLKFVLENGETRIFTTLPISIGRAPDNDIVLANETVSAHHARVYYDEKARDICIIDLDSLNGLFISGQPTRRNVLFDGVRIGLGTANLVFRDTGFIYPG